MCSGARRVDLTSSQFPMEINSACGRQALGWTPLPTGSSNSWVSPIPFPTFPTPSLPALPLVTCYILTLLRSRRNHPSRHSISVVEILDHLDCLQLRFCTIAYFFYPETARRSLEDLDRFFVGRAPVLVIKGKDAIYHKRRRSM